MDFNGILTLLAVTRFDHTTVHVRGDAPQPLLFFLSLRPSTPQAGHRPYQPFPSRCSSFFLNLKLLGRLPDVDAHCNYPYSQMQQLVYRGEVEDAEGNDTVCIACLPAVTTVTLQTMWP